jgi:hypothetical protein
MVRRRDCLPYKTLMPTRSRSFAPRCRVHLPSHCKPSKSWMVSGARSEKPQRTAMLISGGYLRDHQVLRQLKPPAEHQAAEGDAGYCSQGQGDVREQKSAA